MRGRGGFILKEAGFILKEGGLIMKEGGLIWGDESGVGETGGLQGRVGGVRRDGLARWGLISPLWTARPRLTPRIETSVPPLVGPEVG